MKKSNILVLMLICVLFASIIVLSACGGENGSNTEAAGTTSAPETTTVAAIPEITAVAGLELNGDALTASVLANDATFIVTGKIRVTKGAEWFVSSDAEGTNKLDAGALALTAGENNFYLTVTVSSQKKVYTLKITKPEGGAEVTTAVVTTPEETTSASTVPAQINDPKTYVVTDKGDGEIVDFPS